MGEQAFDRDLDTLLHHQHFVRTLAERLLRDPDLADDVSQSTWLTALAERPGPTRRPRAWLAAVVRHLAFNHLRSERRQAQRQRRAAAPAVAPSAAGVAERVETEQRRVAAVLALSEPMREAILLRFYEGLPPRAIAERLSLGIEAVNARLKRGLKQLCTKLGGEHDSRGRPILIVLAGHQWQALTAATVPGGGLILGATSKAVIAAAALVLAALLTWQWISRTESDGKGPARGATMTGARSTSEAARTTTASEASV